jgi:hypothetical protein
VDDVAKIDYFLAVIASRVVSGNCGEIARLDILSIHCMPSVLVQFRWESWRVVLELTFFANGWIGVLACQLVRLIVLIEIRFFSKNWILLK